MVELSVGRRSCTAVRSWATRLGLVSSCMVVLTGPARAQQQDAARQLSIRWGVPAEHYATHFGQFEFSEPVAWPWSSSTGLLGLRLCLTGGAVAGGRDIGYLASLGPTMAVRLPGGRMTVDGGSSVAYLTNHRLGERNLGGPVQFISHAGFDLWLGSAFAVGYRVQHMSNASLYERNPGLNMHVFQFTARPSRR